jgi:hypothetical protein
MPPKGRSTGILRIGNIPVTRVVSFKGGDAYADVIDEPGGLLPYAKKHVSPVKYADVEAQVTVDSNSTLFHWIRDAWLGTPLREVVQVLSSPFSLEIRKARIRNVIMPALDHTSGGNNDDDKERQGSITYLDAMLESALAFIEIHHLGIYRISEMPPTATMPATVRVDLYCERMELKSTAESTGETTELAPVKV